MQGRGVGGDSEKLCGHCAPGACGLAPEGSGKESYSEDSTVSSSMPENNSRARLKESLTFH